VEFAWDDLWAAIALMLIIEGIMPFVNPSTFRQMLQLVSQMEDRNVRILGGFWMSLGLLVLFWVRG